MDEHHHAILALLGEQIQYCEHLERALLPGESQALLNLVQAAKVSAPVVPLKPTRAQRRKPTLPKGVAADAELEALYDALDAYEDRHT